MNWKKNIKKSLVISFAIALVLKIRDSITIKEMACGIRPVVGCNLVEFIKQIAIWWAAIFIAIAIIVLGLNFLFKSKKGKKKQTKKEKKESKKKSSKKAEKEEKTTWENGDEIVEKWPDDEDEVIKI